MLYSHRLSDCKFNVGDVTLCLFTVGYNGVMYAYDDIQLEEMEMEAFIVISMRKEDSTALSPRLEIQTDRGKLIIFDYARYLVL